MSYIVLACDRMISWVRSLGQYRKINPFRTKQDLFVLSGLIFLYRLVDYTLSLTYIICSVCVLSDH